jgi:hypothetical protein
MKKPPTPREIATERLRTLSKRGVKVFGEFPKEVNKSRSPIEKPK